MILQILGIILLYYTVFIAAIALTIYLIRMSLQFLRENRKNPRK